MAGELVVLHSFTDRDYTVVNKTLAGIVTKGDVVKIGDNIGFYLEDGVSGDEKAVVTECQLADFPKQAGLAIAQGKDVFWDDVNNKICVNNAFRPVGMANRTAAGGASRVWIRFHQEAAGTY